MFYRPGSSYVNSQARVYLPSGLAAVGATYTVTTTGAQVHTIQSLGIVAPESVTVHWGDGSSDVYSGTALRTHAYAGAGTWLVTITHPEHVRTFDIRDNKVNLNSADIAGMINIDTFIAATLRSGRFDSADVSAWRPTSFQLFSMPAGYTLTAGGGFANWITTSNFQVQDNGLLTATVNAILWELYQASRTPRTVVGGIINVGGTNQAPSGVFQPAAACPVTVATPGKEVAHELRFDGCGVGFNVWTTVTFTP